MLLEYCCQSVCHASESHGVLLLMQLVMSLSNDLSCSGCRDSGPWNACFGFMGTAGQDQHFSQRKCALPSPVFHDAKEDQQPHSTQ